jgi:hypothetical protein
VCSSDLAAAMPSTLVLDPTPEASRWNTWSARFLASPEADSSEATAASTSSTDATPVLPPSGTP